MICQILIRNDQLLQKKQIFTFEPYILFSESNKTMEMEDNYAVFVDCSSAVKGKNHYWEMVGNIIQLNSIKRYFLWNMSAYEVDYDRIKYEQEYLRGRFDADTTAVAKKIVQEKLTHIIIISSNEIDADIVKKTDAVLEQGAQHHFKIVSSICYLINSKNYHMNLSSVCPFTRYGCSYVYSKHKFSGIKLVSSIENSEGYIKNLDPINLRNFEFQIANLERVVIALNMGKSGAPAIRDNLIGLKKRLVHELSVKKTEEDYSKMIRVNLEQGDTNAALEYAKKMTYEYMSYDYGMEIESKISYLISLCGDLTGQFDSNSIRSNKIKFAAIAKEAEIDKNVAIQDITVKIIDCPIMMDEDVPQILIDQGEPILMGFDKKIVDDIAVCPLRILNYPEVRAKFKSRLSTFTGAKLNGKMQKNPFTRNKLLGAIPLGRDPSHVEVGNYTIAQMVSGGKILGNLNFYYAVIWYLVNEGQIEFLKPIKENVEDHLIYRLRNSETTASMCGLSQFVATRVTTDVAIWYIVNSGYFNLPTNRDVFRYHIFNMEPMVKILKVLKYPLHKGVKEHFFRTRALLKMLFKLKKYNPNFQKGYHTIFKGFYQKGFFVDITNVFYDFWEKEVCAMFIPIDGAADNDQIIRIREIIPKCCKYLSNEEVYYLSTLLDESKSASDIALDYNIIIPPLPKAEINWAYGLKEYDHVKVHINRGSMRPNLKVNGQSWQSFAKKVFGVNEDELFSGFRNCEKFILKYRRFPMSVDELAIFYYNRFIYSGKTRTLPYMTKKWTEDIIKDYESTNFDFKDEKLIARVCGLYKIQSNKFRADMEK